MTYYVPVFIRGVTLTKSEKKVAKSGGKYIVQFNNGNGDEVQDWLDANTKHGWELEVRKLPNQPDDVGLRLDFGIRFKDANEAMMFKLAWGGK